MQNNSLETHCEIALRWMPHNFTNEKSILVQVMAWCRQATSHCLNQCWPRSMPPYDVTSTQWVKLACCFPLSNYSDVTCAAWPLKSPSTLLFVQQHVEITGGGGGGGGGGAYYWLGRINGSLYSMRIDLNYPILKWIMQLQAYFVLSKMSTMVRIAGTPSLTSCRFGDIFITGCTSCQNDKFQCHQWWKFRQNYIFVSE